MTDSRACREGTEQEDLPQIDGSCDACEPDEAQPATQVCFTCSFAFCHAHADQHAHRMRHVLQPYRQEGALCPGTQLQAEQEMGERVEESGRRETVTVERLRCAVHGQEGSLYCRRDEQIVCVLCAVQGEHRGHDIITLREAYMWQKNREGYDLLNCTREIAQKINTRDTSTDISTDQLEDFVNRKFDELHRLVRLEERRTLHLVDLKEAFLTARAAEKIADIAVQTERLQEEMACITQQLGKLEQEPGAGAGLGAGAAAGRDTEARPRFPEDRNHPHDLLDYTEGGSGSSLGHAP